MPSWRMKETNLSNGKLSSPNNTRVTNWNHSIKRAAFRRVKVLDGHTAWSTNDAPVWQVHGHNAPQKGLETINMSLLRSWEKLRSIVIRKYLRDLGFAWGSRDGVDFRKQTSAVEA